MGVNQLAMDDQMEVEFMFMLSAFVSSSILEEEEEEEKWLRERMEMMKRKNLECF